VKTKYLFENFIFAKLIRMFLRFYRRLKDGKEHRYWSIVENKRCAGGKVVQRPVLYLGEINDNQHEAWCRQIEAFDEDAQRSTQLSLFPADRAVPELRRRMACKCGLMRCNCIGRGNGARAGWPVNSTNSSGSMTFGPSVCRIPEKEHAGVTSYRRWCAIG